MWRPAVGRDDPARRKRPLIRPCGPPSPLGGEGFGGAFYRLPPLGGKLSSEARLMRGQMVGPRADEDIRPYIVIACAVSLASA